MKKNTKKIIKLVLFSGVLALITTKGYKLIKGEVKANHLLTNHQISAIHDENIVAHRGFSGLEPDNTYESVDLALRSSCVDMIEIDVRMTNDGKIVLHHDSVVNLGDILIHLEDTDLDNVDETTLKRRYPHSSIQNYIYDDSLFLFKRWLSKGEEDTNIIRFSSFVNWYNFAKPLLVDVKVNGINEYYMDELNRLLCNHIDMVRIQSDNHLFLKKMMIKYPDYSYYYIVDSENDIRRMDDEFAGFTVKQSVLDKININPDKTYLIWTVNSSTRYLNLINNKKYRGNMYIITDHPDYICALGEAKRLRK